MVVAEKIMMTMQEFLALPESNRIIELIGGELVMTPPAVDEHQSRFGSLHFFLRQLIPTGTWRLAPTGLYIDETHFVEPDLFWVRPDSADCQRTPDGKYWQGAPDLIIEILSPSTGLRDKREKFNIYQRIGAREYWIVAPEALYIEVYQLREGSYHAAGIFGVDDSFESAALGVTVEVLKALTA